MNTQLGIQIDPDAVNKYIANQLLESAIGEAIEEEVTKAISNMKGYNSPIKNIVARHIEKAMEELITEQYNDEIKKLVAQHVTEEFTNDLLMKMFNVWKDRYLR